MFKFKGISSEDMQVIIEEEEHFIARASQRYETIEIEGRDGAIFNELGYSVVERPIYVQCLNINKIDDILAWLNGEGKFEYKGRKTTARFYSELEPQRSSCIRIIDTTFIRDPFWYKANEKYIIAKERKDKTAEGETIDLTDSAEMRLSKFNISGNSKQETRSGKNIFIPLPTGSNSGVAITLNMDGTYNLEGTAVNNSENINYIDIEKSGIKEGLTYILSATKDLPEGVLVRAEIYNETTWVRQFVPSISSTNKTSTGIANFTNATRIRFLVLINSGITVNIKNIGFQLEEGTIATDYEQYGASPSPDYSSEVESCGDNVNIFDKDTVTTGRYVDYSKGTFTAKEGYCISDYIEINSDNITISGTNEQLAFYDENKTYISGLSTAKITSIPTNAKYMIISLKTTQIDNVKVEKGKVATPYSKYGQGCINEVICNKNLAYIEAEGKFRPYQTGNFSANENYNSYIAKVKENTEYIYSCVGNSGISNICFFDINMNYLTGVAGFTARKVTTPSNCEYMTVAVNKENSNFMLEEGSTETDYEEHKEQTFSIPTQQPFRAIGDTRDTFIKKNNKWYERHYIARKIFDGTEVWVIQGTNLYNVENILPNHIATNYIKAIQSNYYLGVQTRPTNADFLNFVSNYDFACCLHPNGTTMRFKDTRNLDLATFKSWLSEQYNAGTPVYVDYILETPNDIECTEEQSTILWDIEQNAKTYKNITHMYSTDNVSPVIEVTYFTPTNETINNEGNIQSRPILRLEKTVSEAVELTINDIRFKYNFKDDEYVEIDCEEKTVEYEGLIRNRQIIIGYDYPKLNIGSNKITIHDGDCVIKILRKDRWL